MQPRTALGSCCARPIAATLRRGPRGPQADPAGVGAGAIDRRGQAGAAIGGQHPPVSQRQTRAQYTLAHAP